jgi:hypothetical protein
MLSVFNFTKPVMAIHFWEKRKMLKSTDIQVNRKAFQSVLIKELPHLQLQKMQESINVKKRTSKDLSKEAVSPN